MAKRSSYKRKIRRRIRKSPIIITILLILAIAAGALFFHGEEWFGISYPSGDDNKKTEVDAPEPQDGEVLFHMIDVGQGDAILVTSKSGNMLIDTSENGEKDKLLAYLDALEINSFEYVVFTHPDADHIGNAEYIVENYGIGNIIMPDFSKSTQMYERLISAIEKKNVNVILIGESEDCEQSGYTFYLGSMLNTVIAPVADINDANEMSVVIKSTYGDTSIMLTGDAEERSEEQILERWNKADLDCDVLKVGHHGSSSSTTKEFLDAVSPSIALISCGKNNKYNHPNKETMDKLIDAGVTIYRTDEDGSVVLRTDGKSFSVVKK